MIGVMSLAEIEVDLADRRIDCIARRDDRQRIAVGGRFYTDLSAEGAARARLVLDDEGLAEQLAKPHPHEARNEVRSAARRERHYDVDRPRRIILSGG